MSVVTIRARAKIMTPFFLYFTAALVTGFHLYSLLMLTVYGVSFSPLELVALLGSFLLLVAAYISLFRPYAAARLALVAALAIWSFYAPALANLARQKLHHASHVSRPLSLRAQLSPPPKAR